ncbi:DNA-directed RNA polymerase III subunit RPC5, partial [Tremellales sp. Uapishka_1]
MSNNSAPPSPSLIAIPSTVDKSPAPQESSGDILMADATEGHDLPGPSSTFIPRPPSPPLPSLTERYDNSDESDDEVLATLPIYLSPSIHPSLSVFQYPLQHKSLAVPSWAEARGKIITARMKEAVGRIEVEVPVDAGQNVWRDDRAKELGFVQDVHELNGNGNGAGDIIGGYNGEREGKRKVKKEKKKEEKWGDKVRLRSEPVPNATGYYSGLVHDGALHLHPISKVLQFRTSLTYLDDFDIRERSSRHSRDDEDKDGDEREAPKKPAPVVIKRDQPIRKEEENDGSGSIKDFRNKMWSTTQREEEDKWVPYEWKVGAEDEKVAESLERLLVPEEKRVRLECKTRGLDYLNKQ